MGKKCLVVGCENVVLARGNCSNHYELMRKRIQRGCTSWKTLERQGKIININEVFDRIQYFGVLKK